ncbi:MAG: LysR substrate-binding domain-containing protein, partial [Stenotrophobium sp.]
QHRQHTTAWISKITIANTELISDAVAAFELDVGLIEGPCHQPSVAVSPWLQDELVVVARPDHVPQLAGERIPVKALRELVWLLREPGSGTREATDQLLLPHLRSYRRSIELGSSTAIKYAAAEGIGITCLSRWVVQNLIDSGQLLRLATTLPKMTRQCYLIVHRDKQPTQTLQRFIEQANTVIAENSLAQT